MITDRETMTRVDEVADGLYRICTPLDVVEGGFTFNSYLITGDEPVLFHTGYRQIFDATLKAVSTVLPPHTLRWIGGSHFEGDEFGALNGLLSAAPAATPFGSEIGVLTSLNDFAVRPARGLRDGENSCSAIGGCSGYTHPTFHMVGTAEFCSTTRHERCSAATSSPNLAGALRL